MQDELAKIMQVENCAWNFTHLKMKNLEIIEVLSWTVEATLLNYIFLMAPR
jgi:hypothetical protein